MAEARGQAARARAQLGMDESDDESEGGDEEEDEDEDEDGDEKDEEVEPRRRARRASSKSVEEVLEISVRGVSMNALNSKKAILGVGHRGCDEVRCGVAQDCPG